ncbi:MAG: flagellar hook-length control protein FliK [Rhodocyclaceae bacterium]|nr:flagellar hook-length control protein FliK [Rhodocyclaceae bacterium]
MIESTAPKTLAAAHAKTRAASASLPVGAQGPDPSAGDFATLFAALAGDDLASLAAEAGPSQAVDTGAEGEAELVTSTAADANAWLLASLSSPDGSAQQSATGPRESTTQPSLVPQAGPSAPSGLVTSPATTTVLPNSTDRAELAVHRAEAATQAAPQTMAIPTAPAQSGHDARAVVRDGPVQADPGGDAEPRTGSPVFDAEHIRAFAYRAEPRDRHSDERIASPSLHAELNPTPPITSPTGMSIAPATSPPTTAVASVSMSSPWPSAAFPDELAKQTVWMSTRDIQRADLVLNPPELGRIEISLTHENGQMNAHFASHNPEVRATLEEALPRLREQMASAGLQLGHAGVGTQTPGRQGDPQRRTHAGLPGVATLADGTGGGVDPLGTPVRLQSGLIDLFA